MSGPAVPDAPRADAILRLTPLEVAAGFPFGYGDALRAEDAPPGGPAEARRALEAAVLPALQRSPCLVTFSGGRDSSLILAVATAVADREGLPRPVPFTYRYPGVPMAAEDEWQELVVRYVGSPDWEKRSVTDEFDLVGPLARTVAERWGLTWSPLAYQNVPMFERARGGAVLTGEGGDDALGEYRVTSARNLWLYRRAATRADLRAHVPALLPRPVRRRRAARELHDALGWLRPEPRREAVRRMATQQVDEPLHWHRAVLRSLSQRAGQVGLHNLAVIAADYDCVLAHPIRDRAFLLSLGPAAGRWGYRDRGSLLRALFGDLLPDELTRRTTKAFFNGVAFNRHSRAFVESWDGGGVDPALVDAERLREEWAREVVSARTFMLLQQTFAATVAP